jgi:hypothetical protein
MIVTACNACYQRYEILVRPHEQHLIASLGDADGLCACPRLCGGKVLLRTDPGFLEVLKNMALAPTISITGTELYQATNGLGLPDEIPKDTSVLDALMKEKVIEDLVWEQADGRFYLHEMKLSSGFRVHLSAGGRGAQVLKVTKEKTNGC